MMNNDLRMKSRTFSNLVNFSIEQSTTSTSNLLCFLATYHLLSLNTGELKPRLLLFFLMMTDIMLLSNILKHCEALYGCFSQSIQKIRNQFLSEFTHKKEKRISISMINSCSWKTHHFWSLTAYKKTHTNTTGCQSVV